MLRQHFETSASSKKYSKKAKPFQRNAYCCTQGFGRINLLFLYSGCAHISYYYETRWTLDIIYFRIGLSHLPSNSKRIKANELKFY